MVGEKEIALASSVRIEFESVFLFSPFLLTHLSLSLSVPMMMEDSGRGLVKREGVQGFARTALAGGIPCLLAAKWNIPAKESMMLMTRVYAYMALNKVRKATRPLRNSERKPHANMYIGIEM